MERCSQCGDRTELVAAPTQHGVRHLCSVCLAKRPENGATEDCRRPKIDCRRTVYQLFKTISAVAEEVENTRQLHNEQLAPVALMNIKVLKKAVPFLALLDDVPDLGTPGSCSRLAGFRGHVVAMQACLRRIYITVRNLREKRANYFGTFRVQIYEEELNTLVAKLDELMDVLSPQIGSGDENLSAALFALSLQPGSIRSRVSPGPIHCGIEAKNGELHEESVQTAEAKHTGDGKGDTGRLAAFAGLPEQIAELNVESVVGNVSSRLFWTKYFGEQVYEVPWGRFELAFCKANGPQPTASMEKLRTRIALARRSDSTVEEVSPDIMLSDSKHGQAASSPPVAGGSFDDWVNVYDYDQFCSEHGGLYESYQKLVDPGRAVYALGTVEDQSEAGFMSPRLLDSLLGLGVTQVSCGGQHAAVLTDTGNVYTWGRGSFGRLGHGTFDNVPVPKLVDALCEQTVVQVACGFAYTASVTEGGALFTWGAGENGRLGVGTVNDNTSPVLVSSLVRSGTRVRQVFAGSVHTCVLSDSGDIYSFGKHEYTGHSSDEDVLEPMLLDAFENKDVCQISVGPGGYHTIALTVKGDVYTWGHNRVGQLGYDNDPAIFQRNYENAFFLPAPHLVRSLRGIGVCQVVAGWGHSAVLTRSGEVLICGRNFQGQLGLGPPMDFPQNEQVFQGSSPGVSCFFTRGHPFQSTFRLVSKLEGQRAVQVACGGEHTAVLMENSDVYTFGSGESGQLGHGGPEPAHYPKLLCSMKSMRRSVLQVSCGNNCTIVLTGPFTPPTLFQLCLETIKSNEAMFSQLEMLGLPDWIEEQVRKCTLPTEEDERDLREEGDRAPSPGAKDDS